MKKALGRDIAYALLVALNEERLLKKTFWTWMEAERESILKDLSERIDKFLDEERQSNIKYFHWIVQTLHRAHHPDQAETWKDCPRAICLSVRGTLEEFGERGSHEDNETA
jgi:hypothetical protein